MLRGVHASAFGQINIPTRNDRGETRIGLIGTFPKSSEIYLTPISRQATRHSRQRQTSETKRAHTSRKPKAEHTVILKKEAELKISLISM